MIRIGEDMDMDTPKPVTLIFGLFLIFFGGAALLLNSSMALLGWQINVFRFWPLFIIGLGLIFGIMPLVNRGRPGLGGLFIPAMILLTNGVLLAIASFTNLWGLVWSHLWPLELLALALAFVFFAIYARNAWLLIPALFIGANGLVLFFCAMTGWWASWAVLWTVEPFCVGLMLLLIAWKTRSAVVMTVGLVISAFALMAAAGMSTLVSGYWHFASTLGAVFFILAGASLLLFGNKIPTPPNIPPSDVQ
jgi:hypothetical protein